MEYWERIKDRYDVAFIGAATTILIGIAFIFFTIVVSEWMFPKTQRRGYTSNTTEKPEVEADKVNCTRGKESDSASNANESERNSSSTGDGMGDNVADIDSKDDSVDGD